MAVARREAFAELLAPGLRQVHFDSYRERPEEYSKVANMETSKRKYEEDLKIAGLGVVPPKPEGTPTLYDIPIQGDKVRYTHVPFGLGFRVTHEMYVDDLYNIMKRMSKSLGKSNRNRVEVSFWDLFNDSFAGAVYKGFDNLPLVHAAHPLLGGGTYSNTSTAADIGVASVQAGLLAFEMTTDDRGFPTMVSPKWLIHHPAQKWLAQQILKSEYLPEAGNAGRNDINALYGESITPMAVHYIQDDDAWWLVADKGDHDLNFFWREKLTFDDADDYDTGDAKYKSYMRFSVGFGEWRGVFGNPGS